MTHHNTIIIGGGASGLMTAAVLSGSRHGMSTSNGSISILEKNSDVGTKLSLSGGGRCNITNDIPDPKQFLEHFPQSKQYLYTAFDQYSRLDTEEFFTTNGLPLVTQARNRMFPITEKAADVTKTLLKICNKNSVDIRTNTVAKSIFHADSVWHIKTNKGTFACEHLVLSTGGYAAPETGSTGDGFAFLKQLGHAVTKPSPNLVPLRTDASWVHELSGASINYCKLRFYADTNGVMKQKINKTGRILFTHFGISGPLVLNSSHEVSELLSWHSTVECSLDLFPDNDHGQLDTKLLKLLNASPKKQLINLLPELLPKQLVQAILGQSKIEVRLPSGQVSKLQRKAIVNISKDLRFPITGTMGFERAVIADGGVSLNEVDFKTMMSRKHQNLYIVGDLLDINRPSGGFSLQLCWTTGFVAARHISKQ